MGNKYAGVQNIVDLNAKKVTPRILKAEATKQGIKYEVMRRAWFNFVQFGIIDRRGTGRLKPSQKLALKERNAKYFSGAKVRKNVTPMEACAVIRDYAFTEIKAVNLFKKHGVTKDQFYSWLKELEVTGEVLGKTIFDVTKYLKPDVKKVIEYSKYPWRFEKTEPVVIAQYKRILTVLKEYL
jgi:hypothetical protein